MLVLLESKKADTLHSILLARIAGPFNSWGTCLASVTVNNTIRLSSTYSVSEIVLRSHSDYGRLLIH